MSSSEVSVKVSLISSANPTAEIRRMTLSKSANFSALDAKVREVFPSLAEAKVSQDYNLTWTDEDGDEVSVDDDASLKIALDEMSGSVLRLTAKQTLNSKVLDVKAAVPVKMAELKDALKPITDDDADGDDDEEGGEDDDESLEVMFNRLSAHGADYLRQLGKMISDAVDSLDALVADDEDADDNEDEAKTNEAKKQDVIKEQPKAAKEAKQD